MCEKKTSKASVPAKAKRINEAQKRRQIQKIVDKGVATRRIDTPTLTDEDKNTYRITEGEIAEAWAKKPSKAITRSQTRSPSKNISSSGGSVTLPAVNKGASSGGAGASSDGAGANSGGAGASSGVAGASRRLFGKK